MGVRVPPFAPGRFSGPARRLPLRVPEGNTTKENSMQQAVQSTPSPLERHLTVSVPIAEIEAEIATRLKKLARTAKMQGFRPGKVPMKMVDRPYGYQVRQEALTDSVHRSFDEAVRRHNY